MVNEIDIREIVESVVREIIHSERAIERNHCSNNKLLIIVDERQTLHFYQNILNELNRDGFYYDVLIIDDADNLMSLSSLNKGKVMSLAELDISIYQLVNNYEVFVLPELQLSDAARIALGLKGTPISELVYSILLKNKKLLIGKDLSGMTQKEKDELQISELPLLYRKQYEQYCNLLEELGSQFISINNLIEMIKVATENNHCSMSSNQINDKEDIQDGYVFTKKVLTTEWINSQRNINSDKIYVRKSVIISPLAKDVLKEKGITISYLDEG